MGAEGHEAFVQIQQERGCDLGRMGAEGRQQRQERFEQRRSFRFSLRRLPHACGEQWRWTCDYGPNAVLTTETRLYVEQHDVVAKYKSNQHERCVRGVSWSEVATVPKRKSHRGLDLNLSWNSEEDIWKGWKKSNGTK